MATIEELYQTYLGRGIDSGGAAYWQSQLDAGKSIDWVSDQVRTSREAQAYKPPVKSPDLTPQEELEFQQARERAELTYSQSVNMIAGQQAQVAQQQRQSQEQHDISKRDLETQFGRIQAQFGRPFAARGITNSGIKSRAWDQFNTDRDSAFSDLGKQFDWQRQAAAQQQNMLSIQQQNSADQYAQSIKHINEREAARRAELAADIRKATNG